MIICEKTWVLYLS